MWAMASQAAGRGVGRRRGGGSELALVSSSKPAVQRLSEEDLPKLVPWSGCGSKLAKEVGDLEACTARVAVSLVACMLVYGNSIELASVAGFYWAWAPICSTALSNLLLRLRYGYAGIWSARVLQVQIVPWQKSIQGGSGGPLGNLFNRLPRIPSTLQLEIGDGSPATFKMQVPLTEEIPEVRAGERVDVLVVSDKSSLSRFKALHDVYFPDRGLWISESPYIERETFEQLQKSLNGSMKLQDRQGGAHRRRAQLLLEGNTSSRDRLNWEKALQSDPRGGKWRDLDYVADLQREKHDRRSVEEQDDNDLYL